MPTWKQKKFSVRSPESGIRIEAQGRSAHGGTPWEGENAIGRLLLFLKELPFEGQLAQIISFLAERFAMEWNGSSLGIAMEDDLSGALTMNLGVISASENKITVKLNYRYPVTRSFAGIITPDGAALPGSGISD